MRPFGWANLLEAAAALLAAKQRTVLALVGIVVGVASVSSMVSVGTIARDEAARQFEELGTDILEIRLRPRRRDGGEVRIALADAEGIVRLPGISAAAPYARSAAQVVLGGTESELVDLLGATDAFADLNRLTLAEGRFVSKLDGGRHYCTVGSEIADKLRRATGGRVIGETVRVGDTVLTVVGALTRTARGQRSVDVNKLVAIPIATAARTIPGKPLRDIVARMGPGVDYRDATRQLEGYFRLRAPGARVRVSSAEELIEQLHRQMRLYTLLLGTVGAISLLVGGIGVMNVMLAAVTERKGEIGLRRAVGARRRDIQMQFLAESTILSLAGGAIGAALAVAATFGICRFTGWTFAVSPEGAVLGAAVSALAGVFFGFYPAYRAARLNPVAALRG